MWSWHSAQPMVEASQTVETVRARSAEYFAKYSLACEPPSFVMRPKRLYALATRCSSDGSGIRSPPSCSRVNLSKGLFALKERIT